MFKKIILYDINKKLCKEWENYFKKEIENGVVEVKNTDFKELEAEYVVTAGNSYGWMTGGIDLNVREYYGQQIQDTIQSYILTLLGRYLPVGDSLCIKTEDKFKPNLIYISTMDVPKKIDSVDVFYIFARLLKDYDSFACCGLGTLTGGVKAKDCAKTMYEAYSYMRKERRK